MAERLANVVSAARACTVCAENLPLGPRPVLRAHPSARLAIIGQAPGTRVHESGVPWDDKSGERLRDWLNVAPEVFYDDAQVAIIPMGFCYPGRLSRGGDAPPRPECAPLWHARLLAGLPKVGLTLLVGQYAQKFYLTKAAGKQRGKTLTETVANWQTYLPDYLPTPHPSWRTVGWQKRNPWFDEELLPELRRRVADLVG